MLRGRMRAAAALAALVVGALVLPMAGAASAGGADPCSGFIGPNDGGVAGQAIAIGPGTAGSTTIYVDVRDVASDDWGFSIWLYAESNGEDGLQRGGFTFYDPTNVDPCQESANPDMMLF